MDTHLVHAICPASMSMLEGLYDLQLQINSDLVSNPKTLRHSLTSRAIVTFSGGGSKLHIVFIQKKK